MQKFTAKPGRSIWVVLLLANLLFMVFHYLTLKKGGFPFFFMLCYNAVIIFISQSRRVNAVTLFETSLLVELTYWGRHKTEEYPYNNLNFSYDKELVGRGKAEEALIIRLQETDKRITFLSPSTSGFMKEEIGAMVAVLEEKQVGRIT